MMTDFAVSRVASVWRLYGLPGRGDDYVQMRVADMLRSAVLEEREACMKAICLQCAHGEPIVDRGVCDLLNHRPGPCHAYGSGHKRCDAAPIRARATSSPFPPSPVPPAP
jgi:hypothetical protein